MTSLVFLRNGKPQQLWWVQDMLSEPWSGGLGQACSPMGGQSGKGQQEVTACPSTVGILMWPLCRALLPLPGKCKARADPLHQLPLHRRGWTHCCWQHKGDWPLWLGRAAGHNPQCQLQHAAQQGPGLITVEVLESVAFGPWGTSGPQEGVGWGDGGVCAVLSSKSHLWQRENTLYI